MIIWGGMGGDFQKTGGCYNPGTDTWTATSTDEAPTERRYHTAVWTGTEMIVWGGDNNITCYDTGGRYNPSTDTWTSTLTTGAPTASLHTAVWTGTEMVVWGGVDGVIYLNTGGRYNPSKNVWTPTSTGGAPSGGLFIPPSGPVPR